MKPINDLLLDRLPPSDLGAERALLGACVTWPESIDAAAERLSADDFYSDAHQRLFRCLCGLRELGRAVDTALVCSALVKSGDLEAIGGTAYVAELGFAGGLPSYIPNYAGLILTTALRRRIIVQANRMLADAWDMSVEPQDALAQATALLDAIRVGKPSNGPVSACDAATAALLQIEEVQRRGHGAGTMVGIAEFDSKIGGLFPGELIVLAARPGIGKTSLALQMAYHAAGRGLVYYASLEMGSTELAIRFLCSLSGVTSRRVRTARLHNEHVAQLRASAIEFGQKLLVLHDRPAMTVADIRRATTKLRKAGLRLVVVDYLQILTPSDRKVKRYEQVGEMSMALKALARELDTPVLVLCQLNRDSVATVPGLHQLRESGSIEQDADVVLLLYRSPVLNDKGKPTGTISDTGTTLDVAKNRNGEVGHFALEWDASRTRYDSRWAESMPGYEPDFQ